MQRTVPWVSKRSGVVKTSSVGTFAMKSLPHEVVWPPPLKRWPSIRPTRRSVPGPRKCSALKPRSVIAVRRVTRRAECAAQAATGSGSFSRTACSIAVHSRSSSGSPKIEFAQPGFGQLTTTQLTSSPSEMRSELARRGMRSRPARSGSTPSSRCGSGIPPKIAMRAPFTRSISSFLRVQPRRRPGERVERGVIEARPAHDLVEVPDVDVARTRLVGGTSHRAAERRVVDDRVDLHVLARRDVRRRP